MWLLTALAWSAPQATVSEEVVVYADPFARWDGTRWEIQSELMLPLGIVLASRDDTEIVAEALQLHAVLLCAKEARLGRRRHEVACDIEDVGLQAVATRWTAERDQPKVAKVLSELDARMTGLAVQLQVRAEGGVPNVQLDGVRDSRDKEDRRYDEALRAVVGQVMAGFHLEVPDQGTRPGTFEEANPTLLRIPGLVPAAGASRMVHTVARRGDLQIVQSVGGGSASLPLPNGRAQSPFVCGEEDESCKTIEEAFPRGNVLDLDATFELAASGVAIFDRSTGILTERVWQISASGRVVGHGFTLPPYVNRGRLTQLGTHDRPDVGPTQQLAPPGDVVAGLAPWVPLEED